MRRWFSMLLRRGLLIVGLVAMSVFLFVLAGRPRSAEEACARIKRGMTEEEVIAILGEPHGDPNTRAYWFEGVFDFPRRPRLIYSGSNVSFERWIDEGGYIIVAFAPDEDFEAVRTLTYEEYAALMASNPSSGPKRWYMEGASHPGFRVLTAEEWDLFKKRQGSIHTGPRRVVFTDFRRVIAKEKPTWAERCRRWLASLRTRVGI